MKQQETKNNEKEFIMAGPQKLRGEVKLSGAKNSALKLMAASILTSDEVILTNLPDIEDVRTMSAVLLSLGVKFSFSGGSAVIKADSINSFEAPFDLVNKMRASILVLGPLLARTGLAKVALPGGCKIGLRKIDFHIKGLERLGAEFNLDMGFIKGRCGRLKGTDVKFEFPSVGATENMIMASVLSEGTTVIENAAREPEIVDLANFLNAMGAKVHNAGTSTITIQGVDNLHGAEYQVMPDRVEAGTFAFAAAITGGDILISEARVDHLGIVLEKLRKAGIKAKTQKQSIRLTADKSIASCDFVTLPYPGFPTDLQAPAMALMSIGDGTSLITENVFERRFLTSGELRKMGASIKVQDHHAVVKGVRSLKGSNLRAPDLRGGAALVLAAIAANGQSQICDVHHIERGYENFLEKLRGLGAEVREEGQGTVNSEQ